MHIEWNKVTWYSKLLAVILAVGIFALGYKLGKLAAGINLQEVYLNFPEKQTPTEPEKLWQKQEVPSLLGSWQNIENLDQVVMYKADGMADVYYSNVFSTSFSWEILNNPDGSQTIKEGGSPNRFYKILKLDNSSLEIEYSYNQRVLKYNRVENN